MEQQLLDGDVGLSALCSELRRQHTCAKFTYKIREGMEMADRNKERKRCRFSVAVYMLLYRIFLFFFFFFSSQKCQELFSKKKKKKKKRFPQTVLQKAPHCLASRTDCIQNEHFFSFSGDYKLGFLQASCPICGSAAGEALLKPTVSYEV